MNLKDSNLRNASIILNSFNQKRKQDIPNSVRLSHNVVLLAESFEKSITMLANVLIASQNANTIPVSSLTLALIPS